MRDNVACLLQPNGDARGLERVRRGVLCVERVEDDDPDDVTVAGGRSIVEDRPSGTAPGRGVRPRSKQDCNERGVALVGGVVQRVDAVRGPNGLSLASNDVWHVILVWGK